MQQEQDDPARPGGPTPPPGILDYSKPRPRKVAVTSDRLTLVICLLAFGLFVAMGLAGVSSDRIRIPLPKKVALTVAAAIVSAVVLRVGFGRPTGCITLVTLYLLFVGSMMVSLWFWN